MPTSDVTNLVVSNGSVRPHLDGRLRYAAGKGRSRSAREQWPGSEEGASMKTALALFAVVAFFIWAEYGRAKGYTSAPGVRN